MHINEVRNNQFYQFPKWLLKNPYKKLGDKAKLMYMLLFDRRSLSIKNKWYDSDGKIYLYFTNEQFMEEIGCSEPAVIKAKKELFDAGLLQEVRQGMNKPNRLYIIGTKESLGQELKKVKPRTKESLGQELKKVKGINTDIINTDVINTDEGVGNNNIYSIKDAVADIEKYHGRLLNPFEIETIQKWFKESKPEMIRLAIEETGLENPKKFIRYADSILANWSRQGLDTVKKRNEFEEKRKSQNTTSWKQADKLESGTYQHEMPF